MNPSSINMSVISHHESEPTIRQKSSTNTLPPPVNQAATVSTPSAPSLSNATQNATAGDENESGDEASRPKLQIAVIMSSLCACVFVAAIDMTIISTALPVISHEFKSATGYQWIGSAYVLGSTASTPSWGKVSDIWGRKLMLLLAIVIFAAGSLMCAIGTNFTVFLAGRSVQGIGAAGLLTLVNIAISDLFSMRDRSLYFGLTSIVWALASGVGPVLGGVFSQELSWRWCFWINLPISGIVFVFLAFTMPKDNPGTPILAGLKYIDWSGSLLIVGSTLMLLLGLNFGGVTFAWSSATVINLIVFGVFAGFLFTINEWKLVRYPVIPPQLFHNRAAWASFALCFCQGYIMMGVAYYLPLYFQAVLGAGPLLSGVYLLPFIIADTVVAAAVGVYIQRTGKYIMPVYLGLALMALGTGLLINLDVEPNWPKIVIYQIIVAAGVGMNFEGPLLALQASIDTKDVATATATMGFTRMLSTAISAIIGGVVFQNQMVKEPATLIAGLGPEIASLLAGGEATANVDVIKTLSPAQQLIAKGAYSRSMRTMWIMYLAFAVLALFSGFFIAVHPLSEEVQPVQLGLVNVVADSGGQADGEDLEVLEAETIEGEAARNESR